MLPLLIPQSIDFNPRSPCGERRVAQGLGMVPVSISIHAPRVGSDGRGEGGCGQRGRFQSTLPVWGATRQRPVRHRRQRISIHAPRVGSDEKAQAGEEPIPVFQSTLPVWGATGRPWRSGAIPAISIHAPRVGSDTGYTGVKRSVSISIHAPRVGSDATEVASFGGDNNFNPRSPCGERLFEYIGKPTHHLFQSTLPVWGATSCAASYITSGKNFNPRSPCGERHCVCFTFFYICVISIHAPRVGSDPGCSGWHKRKWRFQSTLPVWGATVGRNLSLLMILFQSTLPVWGATSETGVIEIGGQAISIHAPRVGSDGTDGKEPGHVR